VVAAFRDPRVAPFVELEFSPGHPRIARAVPPLPPTRRRGRRAPVCVRYAAAFEQAERIHGVPRRGAGGDSLIERRVRPQHRIVRRVLTVWPGWRWPRAGNLHRNIHGSPMTRGGSTRTRRRGLRSARATSSGPFYPEVRAIVSVADRLGVAPLDILGSGAGAFGAPQFLPTSYLAYGVDADGDGRVSLDDCGGCGRLVRRYFAAHGWHAGLSTAQRRAAVWQYKSLHRVCRHCFSLLPHASANRERPPGAPHVPQTPQQHRPQRLRQATAGS